MARFPLEDLKEQIDLLFNPEPREGIVRHGLSLPRLKETHGLDLSYLETLDWEGSTGHKHTRLCGAKESGLDTTLLGGGATVTHVIPFCPQDQSASRICRKRSCL